MDREERNNDSITSGSISESETDAKHNVVRTPLRATSTFLSEHAWYTKIVLELESLGHGQESPDLLSFFRCFNQYEAQVFRSYSLPNLNLKTFIRYGGPSALPTNEIAIQSAGQVKTAEILSTLMMGYTLADTLALQKGEVSLNPAYQPNKLIKSQWPRYHRLKSVKKILSTFRSTAMDPGRSELDQDLQPVDTSLQQLKDLARLVFEIDCNKIHQNILIAAMNLRQILTHNESNELHGAGELESTLTRHKQSLSDHEQTRVLDIFKAATSEGGSMRLPLQIALFISPLALLVPVGLHASRYSQANMVLDSHALGNGKPPLILKIEKLVMDTLFKIARGEVRVKAGVHDLALGLPWAEIRDLAENDGIDNWFMPQSTHIAINTLMDSPAVEARRDEPTTQENHHADTDEAKSRKKTQKEVIEQDKEQATEQDEEVVVCEKDREVNEQDARGKQDAGEKQEAGGKQDAGEEQNMEGEEDAGEEQNMEGEEDAEGEEDVEGKQDAEGKQGAQGKQGAEEKKGAEGEEGQQEENVNQGKRAGLEWQESLANKKWLMDTMKSAMKKLDSDKNNEEVQEEGQENGVTEEKQTPIVIEDEFDDPMTEEEPSAGASGAGVGEVDDPMMGDKTAGTSAVEMEQFDDPMTGAKTAGILGVEAKGVDDPTMADRAAEITNAEAEKVDEPMTAETANAAATKHTDGGPELRRSKRKGQWEDEKTAEEAKKSKSSDAKPTKRRKKSKKKKKTEEDDSVSSETSLSLSDDDIQEWPGPIPTEMDVDSKLWVFTEPLITLDIDDTPGKVEESEDWRLADAMGNWHIYKPAVHYKGMMDLLKDLKRTVEANYVDGQPLHVADPDKSTIKVFTHRELQAMAPAVRQEWFRKKHILETDRPVDDVKFDKAGLERMGCITNVFSVHDLSIEGKDDPNRRVKHGTLAQVLACSKVKNGKTANVLDLPLPFGTFNANTLSTDTVAWRDGNKSNPEKVLSYPAGDTKWGLVALAGALHPVHIDAHGAGTFIDPLTGAKWWIIAVPMDASMGFRQFADISQFLSPYFDLDKSGAGLWKLEAVLLKPGTRLYMRPNTPHAVFTPEHAICEGGHFFSTTTLADTFYGIVHAFVGNNYITNTAHQACWLLLRRTTQLYHLGLVKGSFDEDDTAWAHVPHLTTMDSVSDLLAACSLSILSNVLDFETYRHPNQDKDEQFASDLTDDQICQMERFDYNSKSPDDRAGCVYARGLALDLLQWFSVHYLLIGPSNEAEVSTHDVLVRNLCHQAYMVWLAKKQAVREGVKGAPHCTLGLLSRQLHGLFHDDSKPGQLLNKMMHEDSESETFMFTDFTGWTVKKRPNSSYDSAEIVELGMTPLDQRYAIGRVVDFNIAKLEDH